MWSPWASSEWLNFAPRRMVASPPNVQEVVFPVVMESDATRPDFTWVTSPGAAWLIFVGGTKALTKSRIAARKIGSTMRGRPILLLVKQAVVARKQMEV